MMKNNKWQIISAVIMLITSAAPVAAAEIGFAAPKVEFALEEEFAVSVFLNTNGEPINALEGEIVYPANLLELKEVRDGNSVINLWIEKPHSVAGNTIVFSGITPGGYNGDHGLLLTAIFRTKTSGSGAVVLSKTAALVADGAGTPAPMSTGSFNFSVSSVLFDQSQQLPAAPDMVAPEKFIPSISHSPDIFNGQYFIAFATQDKGTGIDHYEVCEGDKNTCVTAGSPYLLLNQELNKTVFVKAFDKSGNEQVATVAAPNPEFNYGVILFIAAVLFLTFAYFIKRKILLKK